MYRQFNIQQFYVLPTHFIYVFCVDLRTNSDDTLRLILSEIITTTVRADLISNCSIQGQYGTHCYNEISTPPPPELPKNAPRIPV